MNTPYFRHWETISGRTERRGLCPGPPERISRHCVCREINEGVSQDVLSIGAVLDVRTRHHLYRIVNREAGKFLIAGHPEYCPKPVLVQFHGSTWGGSMIKNSYIGRGMCMEFRHPVHGVIITSPVEQIMERSDGGLEGKP